MPYERDRDPIRGVNPIPDKLVNAIVYAENERQVGVADATLPEVSYMMEKLSGLGIAGELDTPTIGHFEGMQLKLSWRSYTKEAVALLVPKVHKLEIRAAVQYSDPSTGTYEVRAVKVVAYASPKKSGLGKTEPGKRMDSDSEFEVEAIAVWMDGECLMDIDKLNFKAEINGVDTLAKVRQALGLE